MSADFICGLVQDEMILCWTALPLLRCLLLRVWIQKPDLQQEHRPSQPPVEQQGHIFNILSVTDILFHCILFYINLLNLIHVLLYHHFIVCASIRQWVLFGSSNKDHQVKKVVCVSVNETNLYSISEMCLIHVENKWEIQPILFNYIIYFYILSLTKIWVFCVFLNWS